MKNKKFYFGVLAVVVVIFVAVMAVVNHRYQENLLIRQMFYDLAETKQDTVVHFSFKDTSEFICRIQPLETMTVWETNNENKPYIVSYPKGSMVIALNSDWGIFENNGLLTSIIIDRKVYEDKELAAIENSVKALSEKYKSLKADFPEKITDAEFRQEMLSKSYVDLMEDAGYGYISQLTKIVYDWYTR